MKDKENGLLNENEEKEKDSLDLHETGRRESDSPSVWYGQLLKVLPLSP